MFEDNITSVGEIVKAAKFEIKSKVFYVFLAPKNAEAPSVAVIKGKVTYDDKEGDIPFSVGMWNPIVLDSITPSAEDIQNYRIFVGGQY